MSAEPSIRRRRAAAACSGLVLAAVLAVSAPAWADPVKTHPPSTAGREVVGDVIDITGLRERPRGDTQLPWALPEGFTRAPAEPEPDHSLRDEVLHPVDREELRRLLEVERQLNW
jgi:hypothetical protein